MRELTEFEKEDIKLRAQFWNGLAIWMAGGGTLGWVGFFATRFQQGEPIPDGIWQFLALWAVMVIVTALSARMTLRLGYGAPSPIDKLRQVLSRRRSSSDRK